MHRSLGSPLSVFHHHFPPVLRVLLPLLVRQIKTSVKFIFRRIVVVIVELIFLVVLCILIDNLVFLPLVIATTALTLAFELLAFVLFLGIVIVTIFFIVLILTVWMSITSDKSYILFIFVINVISF